MGGFDSTYEGLKRCQGTCKRPARASFDSTYEGLKQTTNIGAVVRTGSSFDSTYEGWKP